MVMLGVMRLMGAYAGRILGAIGNAIARSRRRRAARDMLRWDDNMLRDIGLTRYDVIDCLSSPGTDPSDFLDRRRMARRESRPPAVRRHAA